MLFNPVLSMEIHQLIGNCWEVVYRDSRGLPIWTVLLDKWEGLLGRTTFNWSGSRPTSVYEGLDIEGQEIVRYGHLNRFWFWEFSDTPYKKGTA